MQSICCSNLSQSEFSNVDLFRRKIPELADRLLSLGEYTSSHPAVLTRHDIVPNYEGGIGHRSWCREVLSKEEKMLLPLKLGWLRSVRLACPIMSIMLCRFPVGEHRKDSTRHITTPVSHLSLESTRPCTASVRAVVADPPPAAPVAPAAPAAPAAPVLPDPGKRPGSHLANLARSLCAQAWSVPVSRPTFPKRHRQSSTRTATAEGY